MLVYSTLYTVQGMTQAEADVLRVTEEGLAAILALRPTVHARSNVFPIFKGQAVSAAWDVARADVCKQSVGLWFSEVAQDIVDFAGIPLPLEKFSPSSGEIITEDECYGVLLGYSIQPQRIKDYLLSENGLHFEDMLRFMNHAMKRGGCYAVPPEEHPTKLARRVYNTQRMRASL